MNKRMIWRVILGLVAMLFGSVPHLAQAECAPPAKPLDVRVANWGLGNGNHRFQSKSVISAANAAQLQLRWVFALGDGEDKSPHSSPVVTEDTIYISSQHGIVHALDRNTGCERWRFDAKNDIRTAIGLYSLKNKRNGKQRRMLVFAGVDAWVYVIDAYDGKLIWRRQVDDQRFAMITGTPTFADDKLIVGLSSYEAMIAAMPFYPCCQFRGTVLALDARTGEEVWHRHLIPQHPKPLSSNGLWTTSWGPSGIPIWSRPAVDSEHGRVFVGTGENYSGTESSSHSDAVVALDLESGKLLWSHQFLIGDIWNLSCDLPWLALNCRQTKAGPDLDFGAAPVSARVEGGLGRMVFGGQKSGRVYAMNAKDGTLVWEQEPGRGGKLGGVHWGMAYHPTDKMLYVPVNDQGGDFLVNPEGDGHPGIYAYNAKNGELKWKYDDGRACPPKNCTHGFSAAIMINEEVLASATHDGEIVLLDRKTGAKLWQFDTDKKWTAVNADAIGGDQAQGGAIDVHGPVLVDDLLIVQSGYGSMGSKGGNALMIFGLPPGTVPAIPADNKKPADSKSAENKPADQKATGKNTDEKPAVPAHSKSGRPPSHEPAPTQPVTPHEPAVAPTMQTSPNGSAPLPKMPSTTDVARPEH